MAGVEKLTMKLFGFGAISGMSFLWRGKAPKINYFFVVRNLCGKWIFRKPFMMADALVSVFVVSFAISAVFSMGCKAKIGNSIIVPVPIDMVDLFFGPHFVSEKPSQTMSGVRYPIKLDVPVSFVSLNVSGHTSDLNSWARRCPYESPSFGIIMKRLEKFFMFCHPANLPEHETDCNRKKA